MGAEERENQGKGRRRRSQPGHGVKKSDSLVQMRKQVITPRMSVYIPRYNTHLRIPNAHTCTHYTVHSHQHTHLNISTPPCFTTCTEDTHTHTSPPHYPPTTPLHEHNSYNSSCQIHRSLARTQHQVFALLRHLPISWRSRYTLRKTCFGPPTHKQGGVLSVYSMVPGGQ